jgi:CrcB protein
LRRIGRKIAKVLFPMLIYLFVALGGALGSMARYGMGVSFSTLTGLASPWGTILINILGSLAIGFFAAATGPGGRMMVPTDGRAFLLAGICGGFTTFSTFSFQTLELARHGRWLLAGTNAVLSVVLCLVAVAVGHWLATSFGRA